MSLFDASAFERWRATAAMHLDAARHNRGTADHIAVFLAEQSTQCALKGLLHGVGARNHAWGHAVLELAHAAREQAGLLLDDESEAGLRSLAREYQATRYPDVLPSGTPADHFDEEDADRAIETAAAVMRTVERRFEALQRAEPGASEGDSSAGPTGTGA